jgi:hypothetical protein
MRTGYRDRWAIAVGSVFLGYLFVNLGQPESLFQLWRKPFYLRDIAITSGIAALVWLAVRGATVALDRRFDWLRRPGARLVAQVLLGFGAPALLSLALTLLFFEFVIGQPIAESTFPIYEFPISLLVIAFLNAFYVGLYFYRKAVVAAPTSLVPAAEAPVEAVSPERQTLVLNRGARNVPVAVDEVAYFFVESGSAFAVLFSGEKYLVPASLDDLAQRLPLRKFFRANRQVLLHRRACRSFGPETYGKLSVELTPPVNQTVIISQQKAPEFRKWLEEIA